MAEEETRHPEDGSCEDADADPARSATGLLQAPSFWALLPVAVSALGIVVAKIAGAPEMVVAAWLTMAGTAAYANTRALILHARSHKHTSKMTGLLIDYLAFIFYWVLLFLVQNIVFVAVCGFAFPR